MNARQTAEAVRRGELRATDLVTRVLERIEATEASLHCFLHVDPEGALRRARAVDERVRNGADPGPLAGLPVAVKDNICIQGLPTTCASRILENFRPPYDATVWRRMEAAGAVLVGKTNLDEFAMGSSTENSAFGPTRNPWDTRRVPGGSSGGSAAAVAAGQVPLALGSDTGGSIRQPAAFCGVTGFKPTYGRVSRYGLVAFASSLDQIGPLARDVDDCALMLEVIAGHDAADSTSADLPAPRFELTGSVEGVRLGVPEGLVDRLGPDMRSSFEDACQTYEGLGATLVPVDLPNLEYSLAAYYVIAPAEASSNLARYDGARYGLRVEGEDVLSMFCRSREAGFGAEVKRRIMLGTYALSSGYYDAYYLKAQKARTVLRSDFEKAFRKVEAILMPATPAPAFGIGDKVDDPLEMYLTDVFTVVANLAGLPALVVPSAPVKGLPTGLQILGKAWDEATVLKVGHAFQQHTQYHKRAPELSAV